MLKEQGTDESAKQISFKNSEADKDYQVFTSLRVKSFRYDSGNFFRAITYRDTRLRDKTVESTCFGKLLVTGEYDLYCFTEDAALYFVVRKENNFYLIFDDDLASIPYKTGNFRSELNFLASGCDAMGKEVERAGYTISGMIAFFRQLDACLNPASVVESYYHEGEGYSGFFAYCGGMAYGSHGQFTIEARWRRVWPQLDPNLSLNLGMRFVNLTRPYKDYQKPFHQASYHIMSFPATVQYNLLRGNFQPFAYAGFSLATVGVSADTALLANAGTHSLEFALVMGVGLEVRITHRLWVYAEYRSEYISQIPTLGAAVILP
jgi:hypothetical protein